MKACLGRAQGVPDDFIFTARVTLPVARTAIHVRRPLSGEKRALVQHLLNLKHVSALLAQKKGTH